MSAAKPLRRAEAGPMTVDSDRHPAGAVGPFVVQTPESSPFPRKCRRTLSQATARPSRETFKKADEVLLQAVKGISDLINCRGLINLDFADIKTVMAQQGMALMGAGAAEGENRSVEAASQAISSPLLENIAIHGATGIIINVTGGADLTLWEVNEASTLITEAAHEDAEVIFGAVIDEEIKGVRVTVIATGFNGEARANVNDQINKMQAMAQAQLAMQADKVTTALESLNRFENPEAPAAPTPRYDEPSFNLAEELNPSEEPERPEVISPVRAEREMRFEREELPMPQAEAGSKPLPRDVLLAKAKAFKESQGTYNPRQEEQLSLGVEDDNDPLAAARRMAEEVGSSPFQGENLEVPAYLRRQREADSGEPRD